MPFSRGRHERLGMYWLPWHILEPFLFKTSLTLHCLFAINLMIFLSNVRSFSFFDYLVLCLSNLHPAYPALVFPLDSKRIRIHYPPSFLSVWNTEHIGVTAQQIRSTRGMKSESCIHTHIWHINTTRCSSGTYISTLPSLETDSCSQALDVSTLSIFDRVWDAQFVHPRSYGAPAHFQIYLYVYM